MIAEAQLVRAVGRSLSSTV